MHVDVCARGRGLTCVCVWWVIGPAEPGVLSGQALRRPLTARGEVEEWCGGHMYVCQSTHLPSLPEQMDAKAVLRGVYDNCVKGDQKARSDALALLKTWLATEKGNLHTLAHTLTVLAHSTHVQS